MTPKDSNLRFLTKSNKMIIHNKSLEKLPKKNTWKEFKKINYRIIKSMIIIFILKEI